MVRPPALWHHARSGDAGEGAFIGLSADFGGGGCHFTGVIDAVTANGEARAVGFGFLRVYGANKASVCDVFAMVMRNVCFADESDGVSAPDAAPDSLGEATEFVGGGLAPGVLVSRMFEQLAVVELFATVHIKNDKGLVNV